MAMFKEFMHKLGIPTDKVSYILNEVEVAHFIQGRVRVVYPKLKHDDELYLKIKNELSSVKELSDFTINRITGSVVLKYDPQNIKPNSFLAELLEGAYAKYTRKGVKK